jgi:hypothetical protein
MTDSLSDDERLRADEAQMRRALGIQTQAIRLSALPSASESHPKRRRFVRDGEVPVTVIHRDQGDASGTNALEAARQALREQVAAREHAEHLLQEAQATIHGLQTKLAHERLARNEAAQRVDGEKQVLERALQSVQEELAVEREFRRSADHERDRAIAARQEAEERMMEVLDAQKASQASPEPTADPTGKVKQGRRRGRPAKSDQPEAEFVEWWKPGWRDRIR